MVSSITMSASTPDDTPSSTNTSVRNKEVRSDGNLFLDDESDNFSWQELRSRVFNGKATAIKNIICLYTYANFGVPKLKLAVSPHPVLTMHREEHDRQHKRKTKLHTFVCTNCDSFKVTFFTIDTTYERWMLVKDHQQQEWINKMTNNHPELCQNPGTIMSQNILLNNPQFQKGFNKCKMKMRHSDKSIIF